MAGTTKHGKPCGKRKPCAGMAYALDRPERRDRTGLDFASAINFTTGAFVPLGYIYRRTSKDHGILLNHCPWCGADFATIWPRKGATRPATGQVASNLGAA